MILSFKMTLNFSVFIAGMIILVQEGLGKTLESVESIATCTYSVNVPRQSEGCSPGSYENINVDALQSLLSNQHAILEQKLDVITEMLIGNGNSYEDDYGEESGDRPLIVEDEENGAGTSGVVYTHWGRTTCPDTAETIYGGL